MSRISIPPREMACRGIGGSVGEDGPIEFLAVESAMFEVVERYPGVVAPGNEGSR